MQVKIDFFTVAAENIFDYFSHTIFLQDLMAFYVKLSGQK